MKKWGKEIDLEWVPPSWANTDRPTTPCLLTLTLVLSLESFEGLPLRQMKELAGTRSESVRIALGATGNVITTIGLVILNKYIVAVDGFDYIVFLSCLHFMFTYLGCSIACFFHLFDKKDLPPQIKVSVALVSRCLLAGTNHRQPDLYYRPLSIRQATSAGVVLMNLNLAANSVGFYQLSKLACIPVTLLMEKVYYNRIPSRGILLTFLPLLVGVGMGTINDVTMNSRGTLYALLAVVAAPLAQILTSNVQKELDCNAMQLLHMVTLLSK